MTADMITAVSTAIGVVVVPVVLGLVGHWVSKSIARREIEAETMKLAVAILEFAKIDADIREWAIKILDKYSGVPIGDEARDWLMQNQVPTRRGPAAG